MRNYFLKLISILYTRIVVNESTLDIDILFTILWNNIRIEGI